jgi:hypothetical protein
MESHPVADILQRLGAEEQEWRNVDQTGDENTNNFLGVIANHQQWCTEVLNGQRPADEEHLNACEQFFFDSYIHRLWHRLRVEKEKWAALLGAGLGVSQDVDECLQTIDNHINYCQDVLNSRPTGQDRLKALEQFLDECRNLRYRVQGAQPPY